MTDQDLSEQLKKAYTRLLVSMRELSKSLNETQKSACETAAMFNIFADVMDQAGNVDDHKDV